MKKPSQIILPGLLKIKEKKNRLSLALAFSLFVFIVLLVAIGLAAVGVYFLAYFRLGQIEGELNLTLVIILMSVVSIVMGTCMAFFISKIPLKPINKLINKMNRLAA